MTAVELAISLAHINGIVPLEMLLSKGAVLSYNSIQNRYVIETLQRTTSRIEHFCHLLLEFIRLRIFQHDLVPEPVISLIEKQITYSTVDDDVWFSFDDASDVNRFVGPVDAAYVLERPDSIRKLLQDGVRARSTKLANLKSLKTMYCGGPSLPSHAQEADTLMQNYFKPWSPARHDLFGPAVRQTIFFGLLVDQHQRRKVQESQPQTTDVGVILPRELWLLIFEYIAFQG